MAEAVPLCARCRRPVHPADRCAYCRDGATCPEHRRPRRHRDAKYCGRACQAAAYAALVRREKARG